MIEFSAKKPAEQVRILAIVEADRHLIQTFGAQPAPHYPGGRLRQSKGA
jgi:hypothetical protein